MKKYVAVLPSHKSSQHFPFIVFIFFFVRLRQNWAYQICSYSVHVNFMQQSFRICMNSKDMEKK